MSCAREAAGYELDTADRQPSESTFDGGLKIPGETEVSVAPGNGALHHPAALDEVEAGVVWARPTISIDHSDWLSMTPAEEVASWPTASRASISRTWLICRHRALSPRDRREILGQHPPLTAAEGDVEDVEDGIHHRPRQRRAPVRRRWPARQQLQDRTREADDRQRA